jgi:hypothetical protein
MWLLDRRLFDKGIYELLRHLTRSEYHPLEFARAEEDQLLRHSPYHESLKTSGGPSYVGLFFIGE